MARVRRVPCRASNRGTAYYVSRSLPSGLCRPSSQNVALDRLLSIYYHNGGPVVVVKGGVAEESGGHAAARLGGESAAHLQGLAQWRKEAAWRKAFAARKPSSPDISAYQPLEVLPEEEFVIIPEEGSWKLQWDLIILALVVYSAVMVPFRIAFSVPAEDAWWFFEVCSR